MVPGIPITAHSMGRWCFTGESRRPFVLVPPKVSAPRSALIKKELRLRLSFAFATQLAIPYPGLDWATSCAGLLDSSINELYIHL